MGVAQLGGDVEAEVLGVLDGGVAQFDADGPALFEGLFEKQRFQQRVELLLDVLQQHLGEEGGGGVSANKYCMKVFCLSF